MTNDQIAALLNDAYISNPILSADTVEVESYLRDAVEQLKVCTDLETISNVLNILKSKGEK